MPKARHTLVAACATLLAGAGITAAVAGPTGAGAAAGDAIGEAIAASAAPGHLWRPGPARYGVRRQLDVPVRMADGTVLRADIASPADPATGRPVAPSPSC